MATFTRTTADSVLKEFYLPGIRNQLNNEIFMLTQIQTNSEDIEGRRAVLSLRLGRNAGIGARAEAGTLPTAGYQGYAEERVSLKYNYGRIQLSGPVMRSMGSDRGSFTRALQSETEGVVRDLKKDVNRQLFGTSDGAIARMALSTSTVTLNMTTFTAVQQRQLRPGMVVDIGTVASPSTIVSGATIASITSSTITIDSAVSTNSTHYVFRTGSGGQTTSQKELTGLRTIVASTGSLFNVDPSTAAYADWASYVDDNSGTLRAVTENQFVKAQQEVQIRSGEMANLWVTSDGVHRQVSNLLTSIKRFPNTLELKGGYQALDMSAQGQGRSGSSQVGLVYDADCPEYTAFLVNTNRMYWYRMSDWEFMEEDGAVLSRVANTDAYEASLFCYAEQATDTRNAHARINDLAI